MKNRKLLGGSLFLLSTMLITGCNGTDGLFGKKSSSFKVTWKNYDGSILKIDENVAEGEKASYVGNTPKKPTDDAATYTFTGWDKTPGEVTEDVVYTAQYSSVARVYEITWLNYDNSVLAVTKVAYGSVPQYSGTPTRPETLSESYTFVDWDRTITEVTGNASYKAVYSVQTYSVWSIKYVFNAPDPLDVVFDSKNHEVINDNKREERAGRTVELADASCRGYEFVGWYLDAGYTKKITKIPNISDNMIIYGKFELAEYKIEYDYDNGALAPGLSNPDTIHCTDAKVTLEKPEKVGYEFVEWKDEESGKVYKELEDICSDLKLKAHYEANEYVITLRYHDKSDAFVHIKYDQKVELPDLEKNGYVFLGWYYESDPTQKFDSLKYDLLDDVVLVQKWAKASIYHIAYDLGGGDNPVGAPTEFSAENYGTIDLPTPTKKGYNFKGWLYHGTPISLLRDVFEYDQIYEQVLSEKADLKLTAVWEAKEVEIKLNFDGGTLERKVEYYDGGELLKAVPISPFEFAGFELLEDKSSAQFNGWLDESDKRVSFVSNETVDKDVKLKADWEEIDSGVEGKKIGDDIVFTVDGMNNKVYQFTPLVDHVVSFASEGDIDVKAELITKKDGKVVASHDDVSSTDLNFAFDYTLKANETYLLKVSSQSDIGKGDVKVKVTSPVVDTEPTGKINAESYTPVSVKQKFDSQFLFPYTPVHPTKTFKCWVIEGTDIEYHTGHIINEDDVEIKLIATWTID